MFHKTQLSFDHNRISSTFREIYNDDLATREKSQWVIVGADPASVTDGTGSLHHMTVQEEEYVNLLDVYKGTYIEEVHQELTRHMDVFRVRFMMLWPKTTYTYHCDPTPRFHIPIETNEHAWMIVNKNIFEFDAGHTYLVDTTLPHTALNMSMDQPRLHIVGGYNLREGL